MSLAVSSESTSEKKDKGKLELPPRFSGNITGVFTVFTGILLLINTILILPLRDESEKMGLKIDSVETQLEGKIDSVETQLEGKIDSVETQLREDIKSVEMRLREDITGIRQDITGIRQDINGIRQNIDRLEQTMNQRFDALLTHLIENK